MFDSLSRRRRRQNDDYNEFPCWIPLTTTSRAEQTRNTPMERLVQLKALLHKETNKHVWTDNELVAILRNSCTARRLATLAMRPTTTDKLLPIETSLGQQLVKLWSTLLVLPPPSNDYKYEILLIVPAFKECGVDVKLKLERALESCRHSASIQVLVVDAGECIDLQQQVLTREGKWGRLDILSFQDGGGRGPCLNYGAQHATGRVYTFLHCDTTLPQDWDFKILQTLFDDNTTTRPNSCAFGFGIDTSEAGLNGGLIPPGIKAVETTANIRTHLYSLPYGDQVLSIPSSIYNYIGGFPDQCLFEDYELVSLLRKHAALLKRFGSLQQREELCIIKGDPALCSPRRWQQFGVLHVTYMNSKFVNLYQSGMSPNQVFELYYKRPPPKRTNESSLWEIEMNKES